MQSRYYDPELGRFLNADNISYLDPQSLNGLNLYAYCGNNPVMNVDPNGNAFFSILIVGFIIGALIGGGIEVANQVGQHGWDAGAWNWGEIGIAVLAGGFQGAIFALTGGVGNVWLAMGIGALSGISSNLITQVGNNLVNGREAFEHFSWGQLAISGIVGGLAGGTSYGLTQFAKYTINQTNSMVQKAINARVMAGLEPISQGIRNTFTVAFTINTMAKLLPPILRSGLLGFTRLFY